MRRFSDIPLCESRDEFAWDPEEVRKLIRAPRLPFDDDDRVAHCDADELFTL